MQILSFIRTVAVCILVLYFLAENQIVKHLLDKSFFVKVMRIFWSLMLAFFLFFSCIGLLAIFDYAGKLLETHELNLPELSKLFPHLCIIVLTIICGMHFLYYLRKDEDTILSFWYIKRSFGLNKRKRFDESYHCLKKVSEIKPHSSQTWCLLAHFVQLFLKDAEQADQYLAKARETLNSKSSENPKEIAAVECYYGYILQHRNEHQAALEHMKKAYELDPTKYRKEQYEKALELSRKEKNSNACK